MKRLYILRHAKTAFDSPSGTDFDRGLTENGKQQAQKLGFKLKGRNEGIQEIWVSPAVRTQQTALIVSSSLNTEKLRVVTCDWLYQTSLNTLHEKLIQADDTIQSLMVIGHNPTLTQLANFLIPELQLDNLPTCGLLEVDFEADSWMDIEEHRTSIIWYDFPKIDNSFL